MDPRQGALLCLWLQVPPAAPILCKPELPMDKTALKQSHDCQGLECVTRKCCLSGIALPVLKAHSDTAWLGDLNQPAVKSCPPPLAGVFPDCPLPLALLPHQHPQLPDRPVLAAPWLTQRYTVTFQKASSLGIQPMLKPNRKCILPCMHLNACVLAPWSVVSPRNKPK